jgi:hypothetical protein
VNASRFPRTTAWYAAYNPKREARESLYADFSADLAEYLEETVDSSQPLETQATVLAQLIRDLPGSILADPALSKAIAINLNPAISAELVVAPDLDGDPVFYARHTTAGWQVTQVPTEWEGHSVAAGIFCDVDMLEARDVTGDGRPEIIPALHYRGNNWGEHYHRILQWDGERFATVFSATLLWASNQWADLHFEPHATGQDIVITYSVTADTPIWGWEKGSPFPEGTQHWRWDPESDRYVLWSAAVETAPWHYGWWTGGLPFPPFEILSKSDIAFRSGDYQAALEGYEAFLADEAIQELLEFPFADDDPYADVTAILVDYPRLRAGLCYALLDEPDKARRMLDAIETESTRLLAVAFRDAYGQDGNLPAALAAYAQAIATHVPPATLYTDSDLTVQAYRPSPRPVLSLLNRSPALLDQAIGEYGMPIEPHWADLDGDGQDEVIWLEDAVWRAVWVGWQDESGQWQATGIAVGEDLTLEGISPRDEAGRRGVVIRFRGVEQTLFWDGETKMVLIPPDQRPADWPKARGQTWLILPEAP